MNWVFETYSNVYNTAMMQDNRPMTKPLAPAKAPVTSKIARFFSRG